MFKEDKCNRKKILKPYMEKLSVDDLQENIAIIKINKSYRNGMSPLELYDITRGCWKRNLKNIQEQLRKSIKRKIYKAIDKEPLVVVTLYEI